MIHPSPSNLHCKTANQRLAVKCSLGAGTGFPVLFLEIGERKWGGREAERSRKA